MRPRTLLLISLTACASTPPPEVNTPTHLEDPAPLLPEAQTYGETGAPVVLVVRSSHEGVLERVRDMLVALVDGDRARLERMLAPSLVRASPSLSLTQKRSRAAVLAIALNPSRRKGITPGLPLERLVLVDELRVIPLDSIAPEDMAEGIDPSDVAVRVPLTTDGRSIFRAMLPGWGDAGQIVVSTRDPLIVKGL